MAKIALTDAGLRSLVSPPSGQVCFWDDKLANFGCRVSQGGTKTFVLNHKNTLVTIGRYPTISLSQARTEAKRLLAEFTLGKVRPQSVTYKQAVELFLEEKGKARRGSTVSAYKGLLTSVTFAGQLADVTHEEVRRKLSRFTTGGAYNHRLVALTVFFNWCAKRRYITDNPARGLSKHSRATRARVLSSGELGRVWKAAGESESQFGLIVRLLILTGARRGEIAALRWSWISDDGIAWPAEVMKSNRAHWLPLLPLAKSVLAAIPRKDDLLFPARGRTDRPFSGWSKATPHLWRLAEVEGATLHDIRRSWASHNAAWAAPHILERALSHTSGQISGVAAVYNRFQYEEELTACYRHWDQYLQEKALA